MRLLLILFRSVLRRPQKLHQPAIFVSLGHGEWSHVAPVRADEPLRHQVAGGTDIGERLPVIWIERCGSCRTGLGVFRET